MTGVFHICVAMKPLEGNFAENALRHGVAGLNIDGCRVGLRDGEQKATTTGRRTVKWGVGEGDCSYKKGTGWKGTTEGRWPANILHDGSDEILNGFAKAGISKSSGGGMKRDGKTNAVYSEQTGHRKIKNVGHGDIGTPARFFKQIGEFQAGRKSDGQE